MDAMATESWIEHFSKLEWIRRYVPPVNEIAVNGKTHRRSHDRKRGVKVLHTGQCVGVWQ